MEGYLVEIEIVMDSIKESARSTVELRRDHEFRIELLFDLHQDALLAGTSLRGSACIKRIVIVAVAIDIIRVQFFSSLIEFQLEISAASGIGV